MILAQYRGNSSPGQLADSSGNGRTLSVVGTSVPNPASPTPPEGDRWLVGPSIDGESHLSVPPAVQAAMLTKGVVEFEFVNSLGTEPNRAVDDVLFSFNGPAFNTGVKFFSVLDSTAPFGQIRMYVVQILPTFLVADTSFVDAGSLHHYRCEWDETGTRLYLDGLLVASTSVAPLIPTTSLTIAGNDYPGSSHAVDYGYMDNVIFDDGQVVAKDIQAGSLESGQLETGQLEAGGLE